MSQNFHFPAFHQGHPEPRAAEKEHVINTHGVARSDPYYWMRERDDVAVKEYLEAENAYLEKAVAPAKQQIDSLFEEMKERLPGADESVPVLMRGYYYYRRFEEGQDFPLICRKKASLEAAEEILIDGNREAAGHDFFDLGEVAVSDDGTHVAWTVDIVGRRQFELRVREIASQNNISLSLGGLSTDVCWLADNQSVCCVRNDPQTLRSCDVISTTMGDPDSQKQPRVLFHEPDESFHLSVQRSRCREFVQIECHSTLTSETLLMDSRGKGEPQSLVQRERGHLYDAVIAPRNMVFLRSNKGATDFRLVRCDRERTMCFEEWEEIVSHVPGELLVDFEVFADHLAVVRRKSGVDRVIVSDWKGEKGRQIVFDEVAHCASLGSNPEVDQTQLRLHYSSMTTPPTTLDVDLQSLQREVKKVQKVGGGFQSGNYGSERIFARARDGQAIAISLVYRKDLFERRGTAPVLLYGYGSYGISIPPSFSSSRLSLVDRGFVFAIAHIRGSETFGRTWYEDGKLFRKKNTFNDFIDCGEHLIEHLYARPGGLYAMGGSAGGLLMGAVMNERPALFAGVLAGVPFVDVVTTMLDDTIPLTTFEYDEWGNPQEEEAFHYMLSYSPYDQVSAQAYPPLLIVSGFHDSQVQYWEPAKWIAKLRKVKEAQKSRGPLLMKMDMSAGHGGQSGRYKALKDLALEYGFLLSLEYGKASQ